MHKNDVIEAKRWNATLDGNYLWSNVNFGEAVTEVMTPLTWSVIQWSLDDWALIPGFSTVGNIAGNPYLNISIMATMYKLAGKRQADLLWDLESTLFMNLPEGLEIPLIPIRGWTVLASYWSSMKVQSRQKRGIREIKPYLDKGPELFNQFRERFESADNLTLLYDLWQGEIEPHIKKGVWCVLGTVSYSADYTIRLRRDLEDMVGPQDANLLIANIGDNTGPPASLGPMLGLEKLACGEWTRKQYLQHFGHRGPQEFELSYPRPAEDPEWIDHLLEWYSQDPMDVRGLIKKQQAAFESALGRLRNKHPRVADAIMKRIRESARRGRLREDARSEYVRDRWLVRLFALKVGKLTGLGDDIFFLTLDEVLALTAGLAAPHELIKERKDIYTDYRSLPPAPSIIMGRFDPHQWARDPQRRADIFSEIPIGEVETSNIFKGSPGSAGEVEGIVRCLENPEQGWSLKDGEILVATQTDIAWTMIFPRSSAVITDIGAPLSHAAIVARELGIPAVVGCGNAMSRLRTGDRVRVDGSRGTVTILKRD